MVFQPHAKRPSWRTSPCRLSTNSLFLQCFLFSPFTRSLPISLIEIPLLPVRQHIQINFLCWSLWTVNVRCW